MNIILYTLIVTHITIVCVTLFLHRGQAHKAIEFHPVLSHFMRCWLWLTTGMVTKQWVAIHRKHHAFTEQSGDPHSPHVYGIWTVLTKGAVLYHKASKDMDMVDSYGRGTPDDWVERHVYSAHARLGISILFLVNILVFGWIGIAIWLVQMLWIPFWAAGVVNGLGHWFGYRNTETRDRSTNFSPLGIIIGGEELHNNHHSEPANPKLSRKWFEFDLGWAWLQLFKHMRLAKIVIR